MKAAADPLLPLTRVDSRNSGLERINRILLQNHLETCVPTALAEHRGQEIVAELLETLKYTSAVTGAAPALAGDGSAPADAP